MSGSPLLPSLILGIWTVQAPAPPQPVAPQGPAPEVGIAPAEVESTPAIQRPSAASEPASADAPVPAAAPEPAPEPAGAPEPVPQWGDTPAEPAPDPGVGTTQQIPASGSSTSQPPPSRPAYVPTDPQPGAGEGRDARKQRRQEKKAKKGGSLYNPLWISAGLGGGFYGQGRGALSIGADATYFFLPWLGAGADLSNLILFGVPSDVPNNIFSLTPMMTLLVAPRARLSPYLRGGLGPVVYNRGYGALGRWVAGAGVVSRMSRAFINIGLDVSAQFPDSKYTEWVGGPENCWPTDNPCSLNFTPRISLGLALGSRR
jgi:hypothetical protein